MQILVRGLEATATLTKDWGSRPASDRLAVPQSAQLERRIRHQRQRVAA